MSSVIILPQQDCIHLACDTAAFFKSHFRYHAVKALPIPHLNAVVMVRGSISRSREIFLMAGQCSSQDELIRVFPKKLDYFRYSWRRIFPRIHHFDVAVAGVGIGRHSDPFCIHLSTQGSEGGAGPYGVTTIDDVFASPEPKGDLWKLVAGFDRDNAFAMGFPGLKGTTENLDAALLRVFEAQRYSGMVGGAAVVYTIRRDGITARLLKDWKMQRGDKLRVGD
ncbi:hypothetical protein [Martelella limonii]|uniref:hypothetical protein n=1 Tax=Martelella limonii TaxID=1647649 RepID=UPI00158121F5|nr:hypothetical protein [Martelella limonii]